MARGGLALVALLAVTGVGCGSSGREIAPRPTASASTTTSSSVAAQAAPPALVAPAVPPSAPVATSADDASIPSTAGACVTDGLAARAAQLTLAHAARQGIARVFLADCAFDAEHCGADRRPVADSDAGTACVVDVRPMDGYVEVRVIPKAQQGAPRWIDASFDASPADPPRRFYVGASTWAVGRRHPEVVVGGVDGHISHTHGGASARIGDAEILVRNDSSAPLRISARRVEWLTSGSCEVPTEVRERPRLAGLTLRDGETQAPEVVAPANATSTVTVWFAPQDAYYSYCDRFAARLTLEVDSETFVVVAEWEVTRREPMRQEGE